MEKEVKYAIIDIGSNSVRLMLWADGKTLYKKVKTTRLGEGLDATGKILPLAADRTALAIEEFAAEGREAGAKVVAFATAAVRSAANGEEFCGLVQCRTGVDIDVVSGQEEARLAVLGALGDADGGVIDIGGASTEICLVEGGRAAFSRSFNVGAVRLHDSCGEDIEALSSRIEEELVALPRAQGKRIYAVGGTASTLSCLKRELSVYDPAVLQETPLGIQWVGDVTKLLFSLSLEERKTLKGMDPARADILAGAALLLQTIMKKMGLDEVRFSDRDNLEGYLALRELR